MSFTHHLLEIVKRDAWLAAGIAVGSFAVSLLLTVAVVIRIPADYFITEQAPLPFAGHSLPVRWAARIGLNLLGLLLIVIGIVMSLPGVPGQGLLTILFGVMLLDVPGKRSLERKLIRRPSILKSVNRLRARYAKPPILVEVPEREVEP